VYNVYLLSHLLCSLFSAIGWLSQLPMVSKLPAAHIRAIASAVWFRRGQKNLELHLSQDTFRCVCFVKHYHHMNTFTVHCWNTPSP